MQRELTLPADAGGLSFSFQVRTPLFIPSLSLEFLDSAQAPVALPLAFNYLERKWRTLGADLSAYAGRAVRLKWIFPFNDAAGWSMDDVRLTPVPAGTEFEVWFATNDVTQLTRLGRTPLPAWPLPLLRDNSHYYWRVDVVRDGQTNIGPVWTFKTDFFSQFSQVVLDQLPELICDRLSLSLGLRLADEHGFPPRSTTYTVTPRVEALGEGVPPTGGRDGNQPRSRDSGVSERLRPTARPFWLARGRSSGRRSYECSGAATDSRWRYARPWRPVSGPNERESSPLAPVAFLPVRELVFWHRRHRAA
ncbi:MAG TPA: hypothetical protein VMB21_05965 [Candidatus Limnocylindria bacterium]|nr:hypothetical protein [Candidatus Limnocylindria bacterium]